MDPFLDLTMEKRLLGEIRKRIDDIILSNSYILGSNLSSFETKFSKFIGTKYAAGVGNGTDALRLTLRALGVGKGDKVLTVSFTSPFTIIAILEEGAIPVFCDIDDKTWTIDVDDAQRKADKKTRAIIPVHIYGNPSNIPKLLKFAKTNKIAVVEDACQSHGAKFGLKKVGSFGHAGAFSFYPTKNLGALGDGGIVTTDNRDLWEKIKSLRHGGQTKRFWHEYRGTNSRLDELQAAVLEIKLKNLNNINKKRTTLAKRYIKLLSELPIKFQEPFKDATPVYHLFVIRTGRRDALKKFLASKGIDTQVYYPYPVHKQPAFREYYKKEDGLEVTDQAQREILALPLFPTLSFKSQDKVINALFEFYRK